MTDPMQRAREMLAAEYEAAGYRDEASAFLAGDWTCADHPAVIALRKALTEADTWKQKADFWQACAFEGDKQATEAERQRDALLTREEEVRGEERAAAVAYLRSFGSGLADATSSDHDLQFLNAAGDLIKLMGDCIEQDAHHTHAPAPPKDGA